MIPLSQYSTDNMSTPSESAKGSKRKEFGSAGNRSVSNLTPGQLERKRANDREAQRAIRARTKETIERLQQENKMLQGEKQALQDEVNRLKDTGPHYPGNMGLAHGSQMPAPGFVLGANEYPGMGSFPSYISESYGSGILPGQESSTVSSPSSSGEDLQGYMHTSSSSGMIETPSIPSNGSVSAPYGSGIKQEMFEGSMAGGRQFLLAAPPNPNALAEQQRFVELHHAAAAAAGLATLPPRPTHFLQQGVGRGGGTAALVRQPSTAFWELPVFIAQPAGPPDRLLLNFILESRRLAQTQPLEIILGPIRQDVSGLLRAQPVFQHAQLHQVQQQSQRAQGQPSLRFAPLFPPGGASLGFVPPPDSGSSLTMITRANQAPPLPQPYGDQPAAPETPAADPNDNARPAAMTAGDAQFPIDGAIDDIRPPAKSATLVARLLDLSDTRGELERLAAYANVARVVAWLVQPTEANFAALPLESLRPLQCQVRVPHAPWIDLLPWPELRQAVIERQDVYATEEFRMLIGTSSRLVGWPQHLMPLQYQHRQDGHQTPPHQQHYVADGTYTLPPAQQIAPVEGPATALAIGTPQPPGQDGLQPGSTFTAELVLRQHQQHRQQQSTAMAAAPPGGSSVPTGPNGGSRVEVDLASAPCLMTAAFERHALNPRNWRVTARFLMRYPELRRCVLLEGGG